MSHSHVPVRHLLKQLETHRASRPSRDIRPDWLKSFVEQASQAVEPERDVARVGFRCRLDEEHWVVELFAGTLEIVGGPDDGRTLPTAFEVDIAAVRELFDEGCRLRYCVEKSTATVTDIETQRVLTRGVLEASGSVHGEPVRCRFVSSPPVELGPGLRRLPDGSVRPVDR